jgi:flagellar basal body-associated protein FliL
MNKKNQKGSKLISVVIILAVIVAIGAGGYYYYTKNVKTRTDDQEISRLEKEIG